jgi:carbamoyltransferase
MILGVSASSQGPAAALVEAQALAACEESRLTRTRLSESTVIPTLSVQELLRFHDRTRADIAAVATTGGGQYASQRGAEVEHQRAHAAYAFHSSPFDEAVVVVCDSATECGWSAWRATRRGMEQVGAPLGSFPIAQAYRRLTAALGLVAGLHEHIVEAFARVGGESRHRLADQIGIEGSGLVIAADALSALPSEGERGSAEQVAAAGGAQTRLTDALLELLRRVHAETGLADACLTGGLFYNTHFTTAASLTGPFARVFVPPHPGNAGAAVGAALTVATAVPPRDMLASPFLGPAYSHQHVKDTLDNCKLSYVLLNEDRLLERVIDALARGWLVGWFEDRMEWGPRALGHRSVLANPGSPHVLDNLNGFLKKRPWYRAYGVSVPLDRMSGLFDGPGASPYMQFEFRPRDPDRFRSLLPRGAASLRVHTVTEREPRLLRLLRLWEQHTGSPVLVNTSFNGFHEPLVCTPRDAVRVFYGTGLDVLAIENFLLSK